MHCLRPAPTGGPPPLSVSTLATRSLSSPHPRRAAVSAGLASARGGGRLEAAPARAARDGGSGFLRLPFLRRPPPLSTDGLHSASPIALASWTTRRHPYGGRARRRRIRPQHQLLASDLNPTPPNRAGPPRRCRHRSGRRRKGGKVASTGEESETERLERRSRRRKAESCRHPAPLPASPSPPSA
ncbi:unnamed protein product [Urochloa humidicola]